MFYASILDENFIQEINSNNINFSEGDVIENEE